MSKWPGTNLAAAPALGSTSSEVTSHSGASFFHVGLAGQPHDCDEGGAAAGQLEVVEGRLPPAQRPRGRRPLVEEAGVAAPQGGGRLGHALVGPFFVRARINKGTQHGARLGRGAEQRQGRQVSADQGQERLQQTRVPLHALGRRGVGAFGFRRRCRSGSSRA